MNWKSALSYSALGISFGVLAQITKPTPGRAHMHAQWQPAGLGERR